jgi:hypothetical protein
MRLLSYLPDENVCEEFFSLESSMNNRCSLFDLQFCTDDEFSVIIDLKTAVQVQEQAVQAQSVITCEILSRRH